MYYRFSLLLLAAVITACSSTGGEQLPAERYYYLNNTVDDNQAQRGLDKVPPMQLSLAHVPGYLKQNKLVMQRGNYELVYANYHLWSEVPAISLLQALLTDLNNLQSDYYITPLCQACKSIALSISRFHSSMDGEVVLSGSYQISDAEGQQQLQQAFSFSEDLSEGGYNEVVAKMRVLMGKLASHIQQTLAET
ncbi:MAG: hypothetical protein CR978_02295 [Gammaproteobacteria bacterium]|nr:MAG: hypothetical protein CR978_02295 [Gammaproteobacteria bacterium]